MALHQVHRTPGVRPPHQVHEALGACLCHHIHGAPGQVLITRFMEPMGLFLRTLPGTGRLHITLTPTKARPLAVLTETLLVSLTNLA